MPVTPTYPGVYIEEVPSGVRTIVGVATSITAFIGRALKGPANEPVRIQSFAKFDRTFGGLWVDSPMSYAVQHYFLNGGTDAIIVRVHNGAKKARLRLPTDGDELTLEASSEGSWGDALRARVDHKTKEDSENKLFNLTVEEVETIPEGRERILATETFLNLSVDPGSPRYVEEILAHQSALVRVTGAVPLSKPNETPKDDPIEVEQEDKGDNGHPIGAPQVSNPDLADVRQGLWALDKADLFNILCIPPFSRDVDVDPETWIAALGYCADRRAILIVDPPSNWQTAEQAKNVIEDDEELSASLGIERHENAALYFPRLKMGDPLRENRVEEFAPCGAVAGIYARTDAQRGVWKAPAGLEATLSGVRGLSYKLTDGENGQLNPLGVNCLRGFPVAGYVAWGARTWAGADRLASEWKYLPVRRLALYLEETLYRNTGWAVFEPNDEELWSQLRLNIGSFMMTLFRQGAFQGSTPSEAFFVKCDSETTTQDDIDRGIVNVLVGFAPLKPAEFVMIKISQKAGQAS